MTNSNLVQKWQKSVSYQEVPNMHNTKTTVYRVLANTVNSLSHSLCLPVLDQSWLSLCLSLYNSK